jgi:LysM repeat protein
VVSGDTLNKIAARVNSSAETLRQGNCLRDANQIAVGQILRVPQPPNTPIPSTATPTPQTTYPDQVGGIRFSEYISGDAEGVHLLRDDEVLIQWADAPVNLSSAEFLLTDVGYPAIPTAKIIKSLGTDTNAADGVTIKWNVQPGLTGQQVIAIGRYTNSMQTVSGFRLLVSSAPPLGQGCEIGPLSGTANTYYAPNPNAQVSGVLMDGWMVEVLGRSVDGWYAFHTSGGPAIDYTGLRWLPPDGSYTKRGSC